MADMHSAIELEGVQPQPIPPPQAHRSPLSSRFRNKVFKVSRKLTTHHGWFGDYDYAWLCLPTLPISRSGLKVERRLPPFYALEADLPLLLAMTCGLQHALAMLAGLITPPIILANVLNLDSETSC